MSLILPNYMTGYIANIEKLTRENTDFRRVLYTASYCQLVLMSIPVGEEIGEEVHGLDQFIRCEAGEGQAVLNGITYEISDGSVVIVPAGVHHNIINIHPESSLQLYTLYAPPHHRDGVVHATKSEAMTDHEEFDGRTTE